MERSGGEAEEFTLLPQEAEEEGGRVGEGQESHCYRKKLKRKGEEWGRGRNDTATARG